MKRDQRGTAVVETAITLMIVLVMLFGIMEASYFFGRQVTIANAAREGASWSVRPLSQTDTRPNEAEIETHVNDFLRSMGITCISACVSVTRSSVDLCMDGTFICNPGDAPRIRWSAKVDIEVPYQLTTISMFAPLQITQKAHAFMREEVSDY